MAKKVTKPKKQVLNQAKPAAKNAKPAVTQAVDFKTAFKYPFNRPKGMLNILWILLPIIGWFALMGYTIKIVKNFINNDFKGLPLFDFGDNFKFGFFMFIKMLPLLIVLVAINMVLSPLKGTGTFVSILINLFVVPMLIINFFNKETVNSSFEFGKVKPVFENFGDYIIAILKSIGLAIIFIIMMVILVGIPAHSFTKNLFLADFYRRFAK